MVLKSLKKIKDEIICPPKVGEIMEGEILNRGRSSVFLDLGSKGIGIIYGREFQRARETLKNMKIGDKVTAKLLDLESEEGYRELSMVEAVREVAWDMLNQKKENGETMEVVIKGANKGGLVCEIKGIPGFLPASQLSPEHYPRVKNDQTAQIASVLQKFVGQKFKVKIIALDPRKEKLILSEKTQKEEIRRLADRRLAEKEDLTSYKVGDVVEGKITGVTNFGAFLGFGENSEGLIQASEISDAEIKDPTQILKVGQKVKAKLIELNNDKVYFSLKGLV